MVIDETIAGKRVVFSRHWFNGRTALSVDGVAVTLKSPWDPGAHFSLKLQKQWTAYVGEHELLIEHIRPIVFAGFRPQTYRLFVDGQLLVERHGY